MALSRITHSLEGLVRGHTALSGSFRPAGAGAPTNRLGLGFSVTRTSAGLFEILFNDLHLELVSALGTAREAGGTAATIVQFGDYVAASRTLDLRVFQESGGTFALVDLAADADNVVNFLCLFRNSTLTR